MRAASRAMARNTCVLRRVRGQVIHQQQSGPACAGRRPRPRACNVKRRPAPYSEARSELRAVRAPSCSSVELVARIAVQRDLHGIQELGVVAASACQRRCRTRLPAPAWTCTAALMRPPAPVRAQVPFHQHQSRHWAASASSRRGYTAWRVVRRRRDEDHFQARWAADAPAAPASGGEGIVEPAEALMARALRHQRCGGACRGAGQGSDSGASSRPLPNTRRVKPASAAAAVQPTVASQRLDPARWAPAPAPRRRGTSGPRSATGHRAAAAGPLPAPCSAPRCAR